MAASKLEQSPKSQQDKPDQPTPAATEAQPTTSSTVQPTSPQQATISSPEDKSKRTSTEAQTNDDPELIAETDRQDALQREAKEQSRRYAEFPVPLDPVPTPEPKTSKTSKK